MLCSALPNCSRHQEGTDHTKKKYEVPLQTFIESWCPGEEVPDGTSSTTSACVSLQEDAHSLGCTAVSWCPATPAGSLVSGKPVTQPVSRLVTAGCDNTLRVGLLALSATSDGPAYNVSMI